MKEFFELCIKRKLEKVAVRGKNRFALFKICLFTSLACNRSSPCPKCLSLLPVLGACFSGFSVYPSWGRNRQTFYEPRDHEVGHPRLEVVHEFRQIYLFSFLGDNEYHEFVFRVFPGF